MLDQLQAFIREYQMVQPGDRVICAVSGGADSMALLWALYLLKDKLGIHLEAAHFNHQLRGAESDADEAFVADFCRGYGIPLHLGTAPVRRGKKGLEAAAREARYGFLRSLNGKIATAHTANDNAETLLLNLVRGSGLRGLGGIAPVGENLIRPMLNTTRVEVEAFLAEYSIPHVEDRSNGEDAFLRNRIRHHVLPLLQAENPSLPENMSAMALQLRQDEACLDALKQAQYTTDVRALREMAPAIRSRVLEEILRSNGVKEPSRRHLALAESLVFSENPSAKAAFPGGVTLGRCYEKLEALWQEAPLESRILSCPCIVDLPGLRLTVKPAETLENSDTVIAVRPQGEVLLRCRQAGDSFTTTGGTKPLKKLFIDRKIPAAQRLSIPVLADERGILGVYGLGADQKRKADGLPAVQFVFEKI